MTILNQSYERPSSKPPKWEGVILAVVLVAAFLLVMGLPDILNWLK